MKGHRLVLQDRCEDGRRHLHRWTPSCSCGKWTGQHRRTIDGAALEHRDHLRVLTATARQRGRRRKWRHAALTDGPRPLTPPEQLPDELRGTP